MIQKLITNLLSQIESDGKMKALKGISLYIKKSTLVDVLN